MLRVMGSCGASVAEIAATVDGAHLPPASILSILTNAGELGARYSFQPFT
jgi:hypothetical protein